jgi:hypothetical protein
LNQDYSSEGAKRSFLVLRDDLARILGRQTVDMLIDRGVTEIREAYPLIGAIVVERGELDVASLDAAFSTASAEETLVALNALTAVMLLITARLLGKRVAESLAETVDRTTLLRSVRL